MEQTLIMNKLPLPKYFDGSQWNTVIRPTRKSIPKYLHSDLPSLKHVYIKEKFAQINKFNCPKLEYFNQVIRKVKKEKTFYNKRNAKKDLNEFTALQQQLQYALLTSDKDSNIIDQLVTQAKKSQIIPRYRKGKSLSLQKGKSSIGKYFENTVDLVFNNRKKEYYEKLNKPQQVWQEEVQKQVNSIRLIDFE